MNKRVLIFICLLSLLLTINPAVYASEYVSELGGQPVKAVSLPELSKDNDECHENCGEYPCPPLDELGAVSVHEEVISPDGLACGDCGASMVLIYEYGSYYRTGNQRFCQHRPYGVDIELTRSVLAKYKCTRYSTHIEPPPKYYETKWECHGFY